MTSWQILFLKTQFILEAVKDLSHKFCAGKQMPFSKSTLWCGHQKLASPQDERAGPFIIQVRVWILDCTLHSKVSQRTLQAIRSRAEAG